MSHDEYYNESHDGNTYKINIEKKEKKHSWSTVLTWLYLKTIGRILPKEWNRWAENILYPVTMSYSNEGFQKNKEVQVASEVEIVKNKKLEPRIEVKDEAAQTDSLLPELEREVEELRKQASNQENLQLEIVKLKAQLEGEFSKERERLEGEIKNLKQELAQKVEEIIGLRKEIEEKDEEISELKRKNEELNEANERVEAKNIEQQKTIFEQGQEINRLTVSNGEKDKTIFDQGEEIKKLSKKLKQSEESLEDANKTLQQKEAELEQVKRENNDLKEKVEKLDSTIRGLEDKVKGLEITIDELRVNTQYKDTELESKRRECEALKSEKNDFEQQKQELEKIKGEKEELEEKVRGLNNEISELQLRLKELTAKLDEMQQLRAQLQNAQESKQRLERENEDFNNRSNTLNEGLERDVIQLKKELEESLTQNSDLRGNNVRLEQHEHDLENQISELKEKLEEEKGQHEKSKQELESQLNSAEEGKKSLEEQITGLQVELDTLRKRVKELESSKESTQEKLSKITCDKGVKLVEYQQEVKRLDGALTDQRREWDVALNHEKGEVKRLKDIVSQKNDEIRESGERIKKLKEIVDEKGKLLFEEGRLVEQLKSERKKIPGLTNKIEELQKEKARLEGEKKQLGEVLDGITKEFDEQKELVEQLQSEQKSKQEQIKGLKRQVAELTGQLKTGEAEVKELQKEKEKLQEEKEELKEKKEKAENDWSDLDSSHQRGVQEIGILKEENEALKKENEKLKNASKAPQREEPEQQQLKAPDQDTVSTADSRVSSGSSQSIFSEFFSRIMNWPEELLAAVNSLNSFLSRKNKALKGSFPELKGQHFCHTVVEKSVTSLSNENDGRFESKILLEVLESDLNQTARNIVEKKVAEVVNTYYDGGKNINAALRNVTQNYEVLKTKLLSSIEKCIGKLKFDVKDQGAMRDSALYKFNESKAGNSDLGALLKGIVVEELVDARMMLFSSGIQEIASNIRDKLLSKQKICEKVPEERNTYQLSQHIIDKYKNPPNSDLGELSTTKSHVAPLLKQPGIEESKTSSTPKPRMDQPRADRSHAASVPVAAPAPAPKQLAAKRSIWERGIFTNRPASSINH